MKAALAGKHDVEIPVQIEVHHDGVVPGADVAPAGERRLLEPAGDRIESIRTDEQFVFATGILAVVGVPAFPGHDLGCPVPVEIDQNQTVRLGP